MRWYPSSRRLEKLYKLMVLILHLWDGADRSILFLILTKACKNLRFCRWFRDSCWKVFVIFL